MWFKNIQLFELEDSLPYDPESLDRQLGNMLFQPCGKMIPQTVGWVPPLGDPEEAPLAYGSNGFMCFCLKIEEKLLPPAVLREKVAERVQELESVQGRKLYKNDKAQIKDDIYNQLLAKAFCKSERIYAMIDTKNQWLIVDTSSQKKIDLFLSAIRNTTGDIKCVSPDVFSPSRLMTKWLHNQQYPAGLSILDSCAIQDTHDEKGMARFTHKDLLGDSVQSLLREGSQVIQLGLSWREQIRFTLKNDFSFSGLKFTDQVQDLAKDGIAETAEERFAADFVIMAETIQKMLSDIMPVFLDDKAASTNTAAEEATA